MGGEGGKQELEKREAREECNETQARHLIGCLLFVNFQALFKVSEATQFYFVSNSFLL